MDGKRFDQLSQTLSSGATRRTISRLISSGAFAGAAGWLVASDMAEAKRKKRKKKKNKDKDKDSNYVNQRCPISLPTECPPTSYDPQGLCAPLGFNCCAEAVGGGACDPGNPQCCAPTVQDPGGLCIPSGSVCCSSDEGGGYCDPGETCCPPCPGWPNGLCAWPGYPCWMSCKSGLTGASVVIGEGYSERKSDASKRSASSR